MNKKILIGSIIAVAIIVLSSFSSVVGKVSIDEEFISKVEQLSTKDEDCGCNDESQPLVGNFPIICGILLPITMLSMYMNLWMNPMGMGLLFIVLINIARILGCDWVPGL